MSGRSTERTMRARTKKACGAVKKATRGALRSAEKDLVAGRGPHEATSDEMDPAIARRREKRLRALLLEDTASRPIGNAEMSYFAGLRKGIRLMVDARLAGVGLEELKLLDRVTARADRDLAARARRLDDAQLHLAVLFVELGRLQKQLRERHSAQTGGKKRKASQATLDRPARRKPKLARLPKIKVPRD